MTALETFRVVARRDSESHALLCDAFLDAAGWILVSDRLYEVLYAEPFTEEAWRWTLRAPRYHGRA